MNDNTPAGWYVLLTEAHRERRAELALLEIGFDAYLPVETRWRRTHKTKRRVESPLLPGYLFVKVEADVPLAMHMIREADGVSGFLKLGQAVRPIKATWVGEIKQAQTEGAFDTTRKHLRQMPKPGEPVQITGGKFQGFVATMVRMEPDERVRVLLNILGREAPMNIPASQIAAA